jgi:hypothetical protein
VDEAQVVRVQAPGARGDRLPELPRPIAATSPEFQRGYSLAQPLLEAPPPAAPPEDATAYRAWLESDFKPWLAARAAAVQEAFTALGTSVNGPADEHVVAAAVIGSIAGRVHAQVLAVPAPPELRANENLLRIYRNELNGNAAAWLAQALAALRDCALTAAHQADPAFGPWVEACQARMAPLEQADSQARALAQQVAAEREAERIAAEGPRPAGPEVCWVPSADLAPSVQADAAAPAAGTAAPHDCARKADANKPAVPLSPRDQRYGARDAKTGVRVSARLGNSPGLDARPLGGDDVRAGLAACFAQHVAADSAITLAVNAAVTVDARGHAKIATVAPEPTEATPLDPRLVRCMVRVLSQSAFDCPSTPTASASVTYCMRRD